MFRSHSFLTILIASLILVSTAICESDEETFGYLLADDARLAIWWCEGTYKVMRDQTPPGQVGEAVEISAARNEYEPFQIVLWPKTSDAPIGAVSLEMADFEGPEGRIISARENVTFKLVEYVAVKKPTDSVGKRAWFPDPLPSLEGGENLVPGRNSPVWITLYVPQGASAGDYRGELRISLKEEVAWKIPINLHVFDFTLPKVTHTRTAYGVHVNGEWHGSPSQPEAREIYDLYLQDFARHRVSPYDPMAYYPIGEQLLDESSPNETARGKLVEVDFTQFDVGAKRYLDDFGFNSFNFSLPWEYFGTKQFSPDYRKLIGDGFGKKVAHLREKGWLDKAYCYWFDEPSFDRYDHVRAGMELIREASPGLRRLLTVNHEPAPAENFHGYVDLWVPIFHLYSHEKAVERQKMGEEVWWYVCCAPLEPYPNNFIDHPAIEHRVRFWMMEKYGVEGDLYWSTTYWNYKNPWEDPMSYSKPDKSATWGNGDGYLLYPPAKEPPEEVLIAGPVDSVRWELIREGLEDREYFWLLKREYCRLLKEDVNVRIRMGGNTTPVLARLLSIAEKALALPELLVDDLMHFKRDPQVLYEARRALARAIEFVQHHVADSNDDEAGSRKE